MYALPQLSPDLRGLVEAGDLTMQQARAMMMPSDTVRARVGVVCELWETDRKTSTTLNAHTHHACYRVQAQPSESERELRAESGVEDPVLAIYFYVTH